MKGWDNPRYGEDMVGRKRNSVAQREMKREGEPSLFLLKRWQLEVAYVTSSGVGIGNQRSPISFQCITQPLTTPVPSWRMNITLLHVPSVQRFQSLTFGCSCHSGARGREFHRSMHSSRSVSPNLQTSHVHSIQKRF